jgi:hypothetical protein
LEISISGIDGLRVASILFRRTPGVSVWRPVRGGPCFAPSSYNPSRRSLHQHAAKLGYAAMRRATHAANWPAVNISTQHGYDGLTAVLTAEVGQIPIAAESRFAITSSLAGKHGANGIQIGTMLCIPYHRGDCVRSYWLYLGDGGSLGLLGCRSVDALPGR